MKGSLLLAAATVLAATPALAADTGVTSDGVLAIWAIVLSMYFFPAAVAWLRGHHETLGIFLLNLLLGWTGIGWLGALIWAATVAQPPQRS